MSLKITNWKVAAAVFILIGTGAISVVGVGIGRYLYMGKDDTGHQIFISKDGRDAVTVDDNLVTDVELTRRDLDEIEQLRQQDKRQLLKVETTIVEGTIEMKVHVYEYVLSDGRTVDMRESAGGKFALSDAQFQEWRRLRQAGQNENLGSYEEVAKDRVFSFKREKYILSDGTEIIWTVGEPK